MRGYEMSFDKKKIIIQWEEYKDKAFKKMGNEKVKLKYLVRDFKSYPKSKILKEYH